MTEVAVRSFVSHLEGQFPIGHGIICPMEPSLADTSSPSFIALISHLISCIRCKATVCIGFSLQSLHWGCSLRLGHFIDYHRSYWRCSSPTFFFWTEPITRIIIISFGHILFFKLGNILAKYLYAKNDAAHVMGGPSAFTCYVAMAPRVIIIICEFVFGKHSDSPLDHI